MPLAYRYRDYVIQALNHDKPYDRFVLEQIAGDELVDYWQHYENDDALSHEIIEAITATGYLRCAPDASRPDFSTIKNADAQYFYPTINDTLQIVATSIMGVTLQCARCHNHMFDPIPQEDFYRVQAVFMGAFRPTNWIPQMERRLTTLSKSQFDFATQRNQEVDANVKKLEGELSALRDQFKSTRFRDQLAKLQRLRRLEAESIRDAVLQVAGTLRARMFGSPIGLHVWPDGEVTVHDGADPYRRSIYLQNLRLRPVTMLNAFDQPVMEINCSVRSRSTVSTQALTSLNSKLMIDAAEAFAGRVLSGNAEDPVNGAVRLAFGRSPSLDELDLLNGFLSSQQQRHAEILGESTSPEEAKRRAVADLCHMLLSANEFNLPAYIALPDPKGLPVDGVRNWSSGWLPPVFQGTAFRSEGIALPNLQPRTLRSAEIERGRMDLLARLNERHKAARPNELELDARIASFELAGRMQLSATDALDLSQETATTHRLYGLDQDKTRSYGRRCLMARRLIERGVRFVQIFMAGQPWDTHSANVTGTRNCCEQTDVPVAGLLTDLRQRGLLDSTIVQWGGEFGRTPGAEQRNGKARGNEGRDHHPYGFSIWLAGGGIQGGQAYGATDEFGYRAIVDRTQTADLHATILHLLGLDHERLTYGHSGRDERLTDVYDAHVIERLIA